MAGDRLNVRDLSLDGLKRRYTFDRRELGRVMIVASAAILVVSLHAALSFQSSFERMEQVNREFDRAQGIIESPNFNDSIQALQSTRGAGTEITNQFVTASQAFLDARDTLRSAEAAEKGLEENYLLYRWLVLVAVLGIVGGAAVIYI